MLEELEHIRFTGVEQEQKPSSAWASLQVAPPPQFYPKLILPRADRGVKADAFLKWFLGQAGLEQEAYRDSALQRRMAACLRQLRVKSGEAAKTLLEQKPQMLDKVLDTVLIGVSEFFRDRPVFDFLEADVLPQLLKRKKSLEVCSVGCSYGAELYSMAILLLEAGALRKSKLLGVDCRPRAIEQAREGWFSAKDVANLRSEWQEFYFWPQDGGQVIQPALREGIEWQVANVLSWESGRQWDVMLFRNVAIYLNESHAHEVWRRLGEQVAPGGILVTGKAERPPAELPFIRLAHCVYRKQDMT